MTSATTEIVDKNKNVQLQERPISLPARQIRVIEDDGPNACLLDTARFEHMQRIATVMANCALIPDHLRGKVVKGQQLQEYPRDQVIGNCFLIVNQALRWGFDPFAVAAETYVVAGKLGFQGKLIAALVNSRANLKGRLRYEYNNKSGDDLEITVIGQFEDEEETRTVTMTVKEGRTGNDVWVKSPHQKLVYSATTKFARRHCPEIIMGVFTDDDLDRIRDREKAIETESSSPLSGLIGSGVLKGDQSNIPPDGDRQIRKPRAKKSDPAPAESENQEPEKPVETAVEKPPESAQEPTSSAPQQAPDMTTLESVLRQEGYKCWEADRDGTYAEYRKNDMPTIRLSNVELNAIPAGTVCIVYTKPQALMTLTEVLARATK